MRVKCRYCEQFLNKIDSVIIIEKTKTGKDKKIFLHNECLEEYKELMRYKENELKWFDKLYKYIKTLLNYDQNQQVPKYLITRLQDLRNGTIIRKGKGRIIKSKNGYTYEIILNTFFECIESINWCLSAKTFKNEKQKINYIMAIIDSNINDTYIKMENEIKTKTIESRQNLIDISNFNLNMNDEIKPTLNSGGITKFLEDDEF